MSSIRKANGRLDVLALVNTFWPVLVAVAVFIFWASGRLESPQQKEQRVRLMMAPIEVKIEHLRATQLEMRRDIKVLLRDQAYSHPDGVAADILSDDDPDGGS